MKGIPMTALSNPSCILPTGMKPYANITGARSNKNIAAHIRATAIIFFEDFFLVGDCDGLYANEFCVVVVD